jgi:hypothetical protein
MAGAQRPPSFFAPQCSPYPHFPGIRGSCGIRRFRGIRSILGTRSLQLPQSPRAE